MRFLIFAALVATACAMDYVGPSWPRLPLDLILRGEKPVYSDDKIVGGAEVTPNTIPSQVSLQRVSATGVGSQSCGGSILDASTILNAAHCVPSGGFTSSYRIVAGEHSLKTDSGDEQNRAISKATVNVDYNANTFLNDISLISLVTPLELNDKVEPIVLPASDSAHAAGDLLYVTGWGTTSSGGQISDTLQGVEVPYVENSVCNRNYPNQIADSMLCAGKVGLDSCQGDSGGPLFAKIGSNVQVGIVSWGRGCALDGYPGVYTRVSSFLDWIAANR